MGWGIACRCVSRSFAAGSGVSHTHLQATASIGTPPSQAGTALLTTASRVSQLAAPTISRCLLPQLLQALNSAKATISSLAQQQRELEQRRRANLAFSGQTLVGDNLNVLQVGGWPGGICSAGGR